MGFECSGEVEALGENVDNFAVRFYCPQLFVKRVIKQR